MSDFSIIWRRLDLPGHETARVSSINPGWRLEGVAVFKQNDKPCDLRYVIDCDSEWQTRSTIVTGSAGVEPVEIRIEKDQSHNWFLNSEHQPQCDGAVDIDLNFSPSTNLLPIRRLKLRVGDQRDVKAAWLRFPSLTLEPFEQSYHRTAEQTYVYKSRGGSFVAELQVNPSGMVTLYPDIWSEE